MYMDAAYSQLPVCLWPTSAAAGTTELELRWSTLTRLKRNNPWKEEVKQGPQAKFGMWRHGLGLLVPLQYDLLLRSRTVTNHPVVCSKQPWTI